MINWESLNLRPTLIRGINAVENEGSPVYQRQIIAALLVGQDVVIVQEGQGGAGQNNSRILTYAIPILQSVDASQSNVQALILVPDREGALKTQEKISMLAQFVEVDCLACVEGTSLQAAVRQLGVGVQVIVGTVGRILELIEMGALKTDALKMVVLDGADVMSSLEEQREKVHELVRQLAVKKTTQLVLYTTGSAFMKEQSSNLASFLRDPVRILHEEGSVSE